jgi:TonB-dependent starch-binding outer membrane protein SusC
MKKNYWSSVRSASVFLLLLIGFAAYAQKKVVAGTITDTEGRPLPGVNVIIKATTTGLATDSDGRFSIEADADDILVISFIGYFTQEIKVGNQTTIGVTLTEDVSTLDEVVVVGYGEMKRADLIGAQSSINSKALDRTVNTTIEQAIQGRAAGVYVTQNSGQPGGGISVAIRGVSSINGTTEPLYVIDGIQIQGQSVSFGAQSSSNPLSGINPSDIDDIQVLQGPAATAMYGSRGTNGVVLITTKRGKSGENTITYGFQYSLQTAPQKVDVMNLRQYAQMVNEYHDLAGGETPQEFLDPSLLGEGTDWQKELFKTSPMSKHQLSMSGGTERTRYYLSGEYLSQDGVALGSGYDRYSFRMNLDNKPKEWISIGANLSFNQTDENLTASQENVIQNALRLTPQIPVKNLDGSWGGGSAANGANQYAPVNPVALANLTTNELTRRQFFGGLNLGVNLTKGLVFRTSINTNLTFSNSTYYVPKYQFGYQLNAIAKLNNWSGTNTGWKWDQSLEYNKQIGKHSINVLALHESQASSWKNVSASRTGFLTNDVLDLEAGDPLTATNGGGNGDWAMESYLGRVNYNYGDRYLLTGTMRWDGSVNFGPENKWGAFPSLAAGWRISQEAFFNIPVINELKLRFETGITGNQGGGGYIYSPLSTGATPTGTGFLPSRYSNPDLKWEETKTNNIGVNVGLLENRIQFEFDYYIKDTDNLLMENALPWYMGTVGVGSASPPQVNIGALQNKGWGFTLNTTNIDRNNFRWESSFNISSFKTEIKKFNSDAAQLNRTSWWMNDWTQQSVVGQAPWLFLGYIEEGLFQSVEEIENSALPVDNNGDELPINPDNIWVGDVKFKDVSGPDGVPDGIIDVNDQTYIGNPYPKLFGGFTNTFSYKGFSLSVLITGSYGNDIYNYSARANSNPNNINISQNLLVNTMNYAKLTTDDQGKVVLSNPGTDIPRISNGPNDNYERHSTKWVEDGSFLRLKNVTLAYNVPRSLLSKQKVVQALRVSVGAQNVATITRYSGYDPEVGAYIGRDASATNQAIGVDNGRYPSTLIYTFSLGVDF